MGPRRRRLTWTEGAHRELDAAIEFVAEESLEGAIRILDDVLRSAESLRSLAERGRIVPERADTAIREILVGRYRLIYEVTDSDVVILGVLHQHRDFHRWDGGEG